MKILEVTNLCKTYGKGDTMVKALDNVSFSVEKGEFLAIIGPSGSGKSTLAGILSGANARYAGEVSIGGIDLRDISAESLRKTITTVPFSSYVFKGTLRSNLLLKLHATEHTILFQSLLHLRK